MGRQVLITGGCGFIGSNFIRHWIQSHPEDRIINLDALTYAGNPDNLKKLSSSNYRFVHGNVCDQHLVDQLLQEKKIDTVVHFAAESHVDRSILGPDPFISTNIVGTHTLLKAAKAAWCDASSGESPGNDHSSPFRFIHVSTDEVYGSLGPSDPAFSETTAYAPNSPYSASKAAADHLVRSYFHTYGLPAIVTNCSNNYGPYQYPEKLIPLCIINALEQKPIPVYGDGSNIRDWLFVQDHCSALEAVLLKGQPGEVYNIGGECEVSNLDLVRTICDSVDREVKPSRPSRELITFVKDRPGHDKRYAMDITKIKRDLGWTPEHSLESGLEATIRWYLDNTEWWKKLHNKDYRDYYELQYGNRSSAC